jgi:hypothetical protein
MSRILCVFVFVMSLLLLSPMALGQEHEGERRGKDRDRRERRNEDGERRDREKPDEVDAKLNELNAKMKALHMQRRQLHREREQRNQLREIKAESRERLHNYKEQMGDIEDDDEDPTPERTAFQNGRLSHVNICRGIDEKIQKIKSTKGLPIARKLTSGLQVKHMEWELVVQPKLHAAMELAGIKRMLAERADPEMAKAAKELEALLKIRAIQARAHFKTWQTFRTTQGKVETQTRAFWQKAEMMEEEGEDEDDDD